MSERVLIFGEPKRSEAGRNMVRECVLPREALLLWFQMFLRWNYKTDTVEGTPRDDTGERVADLRITLMTQSQ